MALNRVCVIFAFADTYLYLLGNSRNVVLVIKEEEAVEVFAKPQGEVFEDQEEGKREFEIGKAEKVKWIDVVIYSQADVDYCFWHHIRGGYDEERPAKEYTVLKRKSSKPIPKAEFLDDIHYVFETSRLKNGEMDFFLPEDEYVAYTFQQEKNITSTNPRRAKIHFRGIRQIIRKQLPKFAKIILLSDKETEEAMNYIDNSMIKNSGYRIRNIWIIEHTDIHTG